MRLLIENKIDIDNVNNNNESALILAIKSGKHSQVSKGVFQFTN